MTQSADLDLQIRFFHVRCWLGSGDQLLLADHLVGAFDQSGQDVEGATAEPHWFVALEQETLCRDEAERAERDCRFAAGYCGSVMIRSAQLVQKLLRRLKIGGAEAFGKPVVKRGEFRPCLAASSLCRSQAA